MDNKGFFAIGTMYGIFVLILLALSAMIYVATTYKNNNDYVIKKVNDRLNIIDPDNTDAFQNIINYRE